MKRLRITLKTMIGRTCLWERSKMRKIGFIGLVLLLLLSLIGCTIKTDADIQMEGNRSKKRLTVYNSNSDPAVQNVIQQIVDEFEKENPDIDVELNFPGSQYENIMRVKMAANDLPDVFDTHGWTKIRYGKYLADLRNEEWAANLTDTIKPVITDEKGKVYALVLSEAKDGLLYNVDLLKKYNIDEPKTYDELIVAAEKLKKESNGQITPFYFSGIDSWTIGQYFDYFANALLISPKKNEADALLNGTFDWSKWTPLPEKFLQMYEKGLMNKDVLTAKYSDLPKLFAEGKVAFALVGPQITDEVHKINPNVKIGIMPVPAMVKGDEPSFSGGERYTMGIWKDSKHIDEAKKLVAFFAKPENMKKIANVTKLPPGLKGIEVKHDFAPYYEQYADIRVFPYFDRVYLPNGMWDVMCTLGQELLSGAITPEEFSERMKEEAERLQK